MKTSRRRTPREMLRREAQRKALDASPEAMVLEEGEGREEGELLPMGMDKAVASLHRRRRREVDEKSRVIRFRYFPEDYVVDTQLESSTAWQ